MIRYDMILDQAVALALIPNNLSQSMYPRFPKLLAQCHGIMPEKEKRQKMQMSPPKNAVSMPLEDRPCNYAR
jgi:hypothetical protein